MAKVSEIYDEARERLKDAEKRRLDAFYRHEKRAAADDVMFYRDVLSALRRGFKSIATPSDKEGGE